VKKFELHMDALIAVLLVFVAVVSFLVFQRFQYSTLLQENVDLAWENSTLEANLVLKTAQFDECKSFVVSMKESGAESKPTNSVEKEFVE